MASMFFQKTSVHEKSNGKLLVALLLVTFTALHAQTSPKTNSIVTPVSGPSWLKHLNRSFDQTSMGRSSWQLGPADSQILPSSNSQYEMALPQRSVSNRADVISGFDLYRMNCQGCHGASGQGAPPEINSVINPVRATSAPLTLQRMRSVGMEMSKTDAYKMAREANAALLQRLHNGGESMPAFNYLSDAEIRALIAYLKQLADMPGAEKAQTSISELHTRKGEMIVKSTCHICHDATGINPSSEDLLRGAIPPLSTLRARTTQAGLIRKVTHGAPIAMGPLHTISSGRMPVFRYLTEEEAADVYLYLTQFPPEDSPSLESPVVERAQASSAAVIGNTRTSNGPQRGNGGFSRMTSVVFSLATAFSLGLVFAGFVFTVREFSRLTRKPAVVIPAIAHEHAEAFELVEDERKRA